MKAISRVLIAMVASVAALFVNARHLSRRAGQ